MYRKQSIVKQSIEDKSNSKLPAFSEIFFLAKMIFAKLHDDSYHDVIFVEEDM